MTEDVLKQLKVAHQSIRESIIDIERSQRSYAQTKPYIRDLSQKLLAYLGFQNKQFYEPLEEFYRESREPLKILEFLKEDLKQVKIQFLTFLDAHSGEMGDVHELNFIRDFREFSAVLLARIKVEEDYLFPLLIKMHAK